MKLSESSPKCRKHWCTGEILLLFSTNFSFPTVFLKNLHLRYFKTQVCLGKDLHRFLYYQSNIHGFLLCAHVERSGAFCFSMSVCLFLAPLAVGQRAYVMVRCPSCVRPSVHAFVRPSVCALTFSLNIFFSETTYRILMKFHRNVPTMILFRIS